MAIDQVSTGSMARPRSSSSNTLQQGYSLSRFVGATAQMERLIWVEENILELKNV